ncbi:uncharacterized protein [Euphorbia lathyris]|uniref:uncharacterized protein n=1 Tax=Euphorbia lathyris TaxID=212925 RepID=UPI00331352DC
MLFNMTSEQGLTPSVSTASISATTVEIPANSHLEAESSIHSESEFTMITDHVSSQISQPCQFVNIFSQSQPIESCKLDSFTVDSYPAPQSYHPPNSEALPASTILNHSIHSEQISDTSHTILNHSINNRQVNYVPQSKIVPNPIPQHFVPNFAHHSSISIPQPTHIPFTFTTQEPNYIETQPPHFRPLYQQPQFVPSPNLYSTQTLFSSIPAISVKLTPRNYRAWKTNIIAVLHFLKAYDHVVNDTPQPQRYVSCVPYAINNSEFILNPSFNQWEQTENIVRAWLISSLTEEVFPIIYGLTSSRAIWVALEKAYGIISESRQLQLIVELHALKRNDMSVVEYLHKVKVIVDDLTSSGNPFPLTLLTGMIFCNIGEEYHNVITSLTNRVGPPIDFYELYDHLVNHETLLKSITLTPMVNFSSKNSDATEKKAGKKRGQCFICGDVNHWANKCNKRQNKGPRGNNRNSIPHPRENLAWQNALYDMMVQQPWYPNIGATHHMIREPHQIQNMHPYNGHDTIQLGRQGNPIARTE